MSMNGPPGHIDSHLATCVEQAVYIVTVIIPTLVAVAVILWRHVDHDWLAAGVIFLVYLYLNKKDSANAKP